MNAILSRLDAVEAQLRALQREVHELRALAGATTEREPERAPVPLPMATPPPRREPPARQEPAPWERPIAERLGLPRLQAVDLMNARTLAWAGGVVMLLGIVLLFVLAVNRGWIGPVERVAFGALASCAAVAAGFVVRSRYGQYHSALGAVGAGIGGGYATLLASVVLYELVPKPGALAVAAGIAAVAVAISLLWDSQLVAGLGLVGATLAPAAVALDSGIGTIGTAFAGLVFAGTAVVAVRQWWRPLLVVGVAASLPQAAGLVAAEPVGSAGALGVALGFAALYLGAGLAAQGRSDGFDRLAAGLVLVSATLSFASAAALLDGAAENAALLSVAGAYGALAVALFRRDSDFAAVLATAALTLGAVALANVLDGPALVAAWSAEAAGLAFLAARVRDARYGFAALAYLGLAAGHALIVDAPPTDLYLDRADPAGGVPALVAVLLAALLAAFAARGWRHEDGERIVDRAAAALAASRGRLVPGLVWGAAVVAAFTAALGVLATMSFEWGHVAVAGLWAAAGAVVLAGGARLRRADLILGGALWLWAVTVHVLMFDLSELSHPQKGYAALALAAAALAGGYVAAIFAPRAVAAWPFVPLSAVLGAVAAVELAPSGDRTGFALLSAGAAYAVLSVPVFRRVEWRDLATQMWGIALVFGLAASAVLVDGTELVAAWAVASAALAALAVGLREVRFQLGSVVFLALALGYAVATVATPAELFVANADPGEGAPAAFLVALAALGLALLARPDRLAPLDAVDERVRALQDRVRAGAAWTAGVTALHGLSLGVLGVAAWAGRADLDTEFQRGHTGVSALWGIVGLALLYLGLRRGWLALRGAGFALFGVSLAKIFLFDLSQLSSVARAGSFLAVGAILLTAGFFYQRLSRA